MPSMTLGTMQQDRKETQYDETAPSEGSLYAGGRGGGPCWGTLHRHRAPDRLASVRRTMTDMNRRGKEARTDTQVRLEDTAQVPPHWPAVVVRICGFVCIYRCWGPAHV